MEKIILKQYISKWIKTLHTYEIYTPVKHENHWKFQKNIEPENINLDYLNATPSPKFIVFPQREILFEFNKGNNNSHTNHIPIKIHASSPLNQKTVMMGIRPCDAAAFLKLDRVFKDKVFDKGNTEDWKEQYFSKRRENTILVGMGCNKIPSTNCFCTSLQGGPFGRNGLDIMMTDLGEHYYLETLTPKGVQLIDTHAHLPEKIFKNPTPDERNRMRKIQHEANLNVKRNIKKADSLPSLLEKNFESPLWEEESLGCISCGICTYLCPSCHCFDICDEIESLSPLKGKRVRNWDNCQFPDFTMHSSGHNPRPDKASRLRRRILHKFCYFNQTYNEFQCTGCGRCISKCPMGIDLIEILNKVQNNVS